MFPFSDIYYSIKFYLEKKKWYRSRKGGKWAYWWIDPCKAYIWHQGWARPPCGNMCASWESYPDHEDRCEECGQQHEHTVVTDYALRPAVHEEVTRYTDDGSQLCGNCREQRLKLVRKKW